MYGCGFTCFSFGIIGFALNDGVLLAKKPFEENGIVEEGVPNTGLKKNGVLVVEEAVVMCVRASTLLVAISRKAASESMESTVFLKRFFIGF